MILFVAVVGTAMSKPLWSTLAGGNYLYPTSEINELPQYLAAQQNAHSPYYVYNVIRRNTIAIARIIERSV